MGTQPIFIYLNYIFQSLSLLCSWYIPGLTLSWVIFIAILLLLFLLSLCAVIALLCFEILRCFYNSSNELAHRKSCHLSGKVLTCCSATRKGVIPRNQQADTQKHLSRVPTLLSVEKKNFFPKQQPKRKNIQVYRLSRGCCLSTSLITLYCPLCDLQRHIIVLSAF